MPLEAMIDRVTNAVAAGAVTSPWWMSSIADISQGAALLLPIAGLAWLVIQIVWKITGKD